MEGDNTEENMAHNEILSSSSEETEDAHTYSVDDDEIGDCREIEQTTFRVGEMASASSATVRRSSRGACQHPPRLANRPLLPGAGTSPAPVQPRPQLPTWPSRKKRRTSDVAPRSAPISFNTASSSAPTCSNAVPSSAPVSSNAASRSAPMSSNAAPRSSPMSSYATRRGDEQVRQPMMNADDYALILDYTEIPGNLKAFHGAGRASNAADYALILDYLEIPENLKSIHGAGRGHGLTRNEGRYQSKKEVFVQMIRGIVPQGFPPMSARSLQNRFERYVDKYKTALSWKNESGGLTEGEVAVGITIEEKMDGICPHFERMHAICGEGLNVAPALTKMRLGPASQPGEELHDGTTPDEMQEIKEEEDDYVERTHIRAAGDRNAAWRVSDESQAHPPPLRSHGRAASTQRRPPNRQGPQPRGIAHRQGNPSSAGKDKSGETQARAAGGREKGNSKINLAAVYAERFQHEDQLWSQLLEAKGVWESAQLAENRRKRIHQLKLEDRAAEREEKRTKQGQDHQMAMAKQQLKSKMVMELLRSEASSEEIVEYMQVIDNN